jgi:ribonuclease P protein component
LAFPKSSRILKPSDFRKVYDQGTRMTCPSFAAFYLPDPEPVTGPHFGFTTPRALGKAVVRNRIRRRLREAVRHEQHRFPVGMNVVFNPRKLVLEVPFETLRQEVARLAGRFKK